MKLVSDPEVEIFDAEKRTLIEKNKFMSSLEQLRESRRIGSSTECSILYGIGTRIPRILLVLSDGISLTFKKFIQVVQSILDVKKETDE